MSHSTSKILCKIDAKTIHGVLNLLDSFPDNCESMNESVLVEIYKSCKTEIRCEFLSSILNEGQSLEGLFMPCNIHIFKEEVQLVMSLVCQISLEEISTQNGPFIFYSNSMSSCVSQ